MLRVENTLRSIFQRSVAFGLTIRAKKTVTTVTAKNLKPPINFEKITLSKSTAIPIFKIYNVLEKNPVLKPNVPVPLQFLSLKMKLIFCISLIRCSIKESL